MLIFIAFSVLGAFHHGLLQLFFRPRAPGFTNDENTTNTVNENTVLLGVDFQLYKI